MAALSSSNNSPSSALVESSSTPRVQSTTPRTGPYIDWFIHAGERMRVAITATSNGAGSIIAGVSMEGGAPSVETTEPTQSGPGA